MRDHAEHYPNWSFDTNKGYPCPVHKAALQGYGPSAIHRRTWVFMDHYVPWTGIPRVFRPDQPTCSDAHIPDLSAPNAATGSMKQTEPGVGGLGGQSS